MSASIEAYSTAKGYVQSAYLMTVNPARLVINNDLTLVLSFHMLIGFAVELYLKAYLLHTGLPTSELKSRSFGHNLSKLLEVSELDGFALPEATSLVSHLAPQHGNFEYRYVNASGSYHLRWQAEVFAELSALDEYVDNRTGASASRGKVPAKDGWDLPSEYNGWRIPRS